MFLYRMIYTTICVMRKDVLERATLVFNVGRLYHESTG
jgi:hypothetical protein